MRLQHSLPIKIFILQIHHERNIDCISENESRDYCVQKSFISPCLMHKGTDLQLNWGKNPSNVSDIFFNFRSFEYTNMRESQ
jgi:hypothetical protein